MDAKETGFTHLHVHTEFSLLDGSAKIGELVARAKELSMDALAITDHGVMFGVIDFYKKAKEQGIKPVLGCEVYVASGSRLDRENSDDNFYYHLVLLAETDEGYQNLLKIVSIGFTEGFYYKPRVDIETLEKYSGGIIALSGCIAGPVARDVLDKNYGTAKQTALKYDALFGRGNFFLEMHDHGMTEEKTVNLALSRMSAETGIPLVCANDSHYVRREDAPAHDILLCIQTNRKVNDEDRMRFEGDSFYLKSKEEMAELFKAYPEALLNTGRIAKRCNVNIEFNKYKLPRFELPAGYTDSAVYMAEQSYKGLSERYGEVTPELRERLDYELRTIRTMGFADYFLIVADFIAYARSVGISVGPGRGSGAGSLAAYCLRITNIDPIKYNLIFERFLNPERISMPDFDVDFCYVRRQEVIDYVTRTYGADHVAQIITFGTMAARGVIRDVGRALDMPYGDVDKVAKMIPFVPGRNITLNEALEISAELRARYEGDPYVKNLVETAKKLEGLPRHSSTHAAGVVICGKPVDEFVPLSSNQKDGAVTTQFPMKTIEELGLLKMDFLGLRTLTVIQSAVAEVNRIHKAGLDIDRIDLDDKRVWDMISQAKTEGVFQLESAGMSNLMRDLQPGGIEDLTAGISLYRPGPMDFIPKYIAGKRNRGNIRYDHPLLEPILGSTYGCIVYQEQVMRIVRDLAGFSMGRADLVRKAMSKKKADVMEMERRNFIYGDGDKIPGCINNGVSEQTAAKLFGEISDFAEYAFNKSHAAAYALVAYQTAWLKYYYKSEFMAALLTSVMDQSGKVAEYINECKKLGITVSPPDINESLGHFTVTKSGIRIGLSAVKNVGRPTIAAIIAERENGRYKSLSEFLSRLASGDMNRRALECLIKAGAFDSMGGKRLQYMHIHERLLAGQNSKKNLIAGQMNLFELSPDSSEAFEDDLPAIPEYPLRELLGYEKEVLGLYISGHPMSEYAETFAGIVNVTSRQLAETTEEGYEPGTDPIYDNKPVVYGGMIAGKSVKYTKKNEAMAFLTVEDLYGAVEVLVFPKTYSRYGSMLSDGVVVRVDGRVSMKEDEMPSITANDLSIIEKPEPSSHLRQEAQPTCEFWIKIPKTSDLSPESVFPLLQGHKGGAKVIVYVERTRSKLQAANITVDHLDKALIQKLEGLLGEKCTAVIDKA